MSNYDLALYILSKEKKTRWLYQIIRKRKKMHVKTFEMATSNFTDGFMNKQIPLKSRIYGH